MTDLKFKIFESITLNELKFILFLIVLSFYFTIFDNILVTGGGIIPQEDMDALSKIGVGKLFAPGTSIKESINYIKKWVRDNRS